MSYYAAGDLPREYFAPGWKGTLAWRLSQALSYGPTAPAGKVVEAELKLLHAWHNRHGARQAVAHDVQTFIRRRRRRRGLRRR